MNRPGALFCGSQPLEAIFPDVLGERIARQLRWLAPPISAVELASLPDSLLAEAEVLVGSWGMVRLDRALLRRMPELRLVLYAAGSVKGFVSDAFWERGIPLVSAREANAVSVAEFTLAQILLSLKRVWPLHRATHTARCFPSASERPSRGNFRSTVGLVGLGAIGRTVLERLRGFDHRVLACDPRVSPEAGGTCDVPLLGLEALFEQADLVSLHVPLLPTTQGMIGGELLRRMRPGAILLNTSRGAVIDQGALIDLLRERPDLTAVLDVTHPEPPGQEDLLFDLPNVFLTPHLAGILGDERARLGALVIEELERFYRGLPLRHRVLPEELAFSA